MFPGASEGAVDLLGRLLQFDPRRRISVVDALKHPWLAQLHDDTVEPSAPGGRRPGAGPAACVAAAARGLVATY